MNIWKFLWMFIILNEKNNIYEMKSHIKVNKFFNIAFIDSNKSYYILKEGDIYFEKYRIKILDMNLFLSKELTLNGTITFIPEIKNNDNILIENLAKIENSRENKYINFVKYSANLMIGSFIFGLLTRRNFTLLFSLLSYSIFSFEILERFKCENKYSEIEDLYGIRIYDRN